MLLLIFKVVNTELNIERFTSDVGISILTIDCLVNFTPEVYFSSRLANEAISMRPPILYSVCLKSYFFRCLKFVYLFAIYKHKTVKS